MLNTFCGVLTGGAVAIRHIAFKAQHRTSSQTVGANTAAQEVVVHNDELFGKSISSNYPKVRKNADINLSPMQYCFALFDVYTNIHTDFPIFGVS